MTNTLWNSPKNWRGGEVLTTSKLNKQLRNNLLRLHEKNYIIGGEGYTTNYVYGTNTFKELNSSIYKLRLKTIGGAIRLSFMATTYHSVSAGRVYFDIKVDDDYFVSSLTPTALTDGLWRRQSLTNTPMTNTYEHILSDLEAGWHDFEIWWKANTANGVVWAESSVVQFMVEEYGLLTNRS